MRVALVDDHQLFRKGMASLLEKMDEVKLVMEAQNGQEFLAKLSEQPIDLVLLDLKMPVMDGRDTMQRLLKEHPKVKVVLLTMETGEETVLRCMEEGASGFLAKDAHPDELRLAIKTISEQGIYLNARSTRIMMKGLTEWKSGARGSGLHLNEREMAVLKGVCRQRTTAEIAEELFLSARTVEGYRSDLLEKTNTKNSVGLVLFAAKQGWLERWVQELD